MNGAECKNVDKSYECKCTTGFAGKNCDKDDICYKNQGICRNGGTCDTTVSGGYKCTCPPGFSDSKCRKGCEEIEGSKICAAKGKHWTCVNKEQDKSNYSCICEPGYKLESSNCIVKTGCEDYGGKEACKKKGEFFTCNNDELNASNYTCDCLPGYKMEKEKCIVKTGCEDNGGKEACQKKGEFFTCNNDKLDASKYSCDCLPGYKMEKEKCIDKTGCEDYGGKEACQKKGEFFTCNNDKQNASKYSCDCLPGYKMEKEKCIAKTGCEDNGGKEACQKKGEFFTCNNDKLNASKYSCDCLPGYKIEKEKCIAKTGCEDYGGKEACQKKGKFFTCNNDKLNASKYSCDCLPGYKMEKEKCIVKTGCEDYGGKEACRKKGEFFTCNNDKLNASKYSCDCLPGYKMEKEKCIAKTGCEDYGGKEACQKKGKFFTCNNDKLNASKYSCDCLPGYKMEKEKCIVKTGCEDYGGKEACQKKGEFFTCNNDKLNASKYSCDCLPGYKMEKGKCIVKTGCEDYGGKEACQKKGEFFTCNNNKLNASEYSCDCLPGYKMEKEKCIVKTGCEDNGGKETCQKKGEFFTCNNDKLNASKYSCDCLPGYKIEKEKCIVKTGCEDYGGKEACQKKGELFTCNNDKLNASKYSCDCFPGYKMEKEKCIVKTGCEDYGGIEACQKKGEFFTCNNNKLNVSKYSCDCLPGYKIEKEKCIVKTGCEDYGGKEACQKKGEFFTCNNDRLNASKYSCDCLPGYKLENEKCIVDASSSTAGISENPTNIVTTKSPTTPMKVSTKQPLKSSTASPTTTLKVSTEQILKSSTTSPTSTLKVSTEQLLKSSTSSPTSTLKVSTEQLLKSSTSSPTSTLKVSTGQPLKSSTAIDSCNSNPCKYGGTCVNNGQDYNCICSYGFMGKDCENCKLECGGAACGYDLILKEGYCKCKENQRFDIAKKACINLDKCEQKFLNGECRKVHEICVKGTCKCEDNFSYNKDKTCRADFCKNKICKENEVCKETPNGDAICVCKDGFHLNDKGCEKIDECALMNPKCTQKCDQGICSCEEGFDLKNDNYTCKINQNTSECQNGSKCFPGMCQVINGTDMCVCPETTHIHINGTCTDKCIAKQIPEGMCPQNKCKSDEKYGFVCICDGKYKQTENGIYCKRKNMCIEGGGNTECTKRKAFCKEDENEKKGYVCKCEEGFDFYQNACTPVCDIKENKEKCLQVSGVCVLDVNYKPSCRCPPLLEKDSKGICVEKVKHSFIGSIKIPKTIYGINLNTLKLKENEQIPNFNHSKITQDFIKSLEGVYGKNYKDVSIISCRDQKEDFACSIELKFHKDPQETKTLNTISTPSVCVPLKQPEYCMIHPNFVMKRPNQVIFQKTDPCDDIVKNELCGSMTTCAKTDGKNFKADGEFFNCTCKPDFYSKDYYQPIKNENSFIHICEDRKDCSRPDSCPKNTSCVITPSSYECYCEEGYRNTSHNIKENGCIGVCDNSPCGEHGTCERFEKHEYMCKCDPSYTGVHCETPNERKEIEDNNLAVTLSVSIILSLLIVISIIGIFILYKKNKYGGKYGSKHAIFKPLHFLSKKVRLMCNPKYDGEDYSVAHQGISETFDHRSNDDSERMQNADCIELEIREKIKRGDQALANAATSRKNEKLGQVNSKASEKTEVFRLRL
ncbi:neurogenic locus Notch protein-like isoform X14 [Parasteatoda tepidariorum]|uniref:neurogenic locus Notch protein-like isoform X14 n=1 Tax=Parasteatoda tepidariorum TaxID=114398 RepID=UPI0039BC6C07